MINQVSYPTQTPNPQTRRAFLNNQLAAAYASGDPLHNLKQYDRPGVSRGMGQAAQAGIDASRSLAQGIADAYGASNQYATAQANRNLDQEVVDEQFGQQATALQQQRNYAQQMARINARQQQLGMVTGLLGGLLG